MARITGFSLTIILLTCFSNLAWGQTTVPHTFSAGTAASANEVNANFDALAAAIDGVGGTTLTPVTGYGSGYGASDSLADRNVKLYKRFNSGTGETSYDIWMYFQNCTVNVDGTTPTSFAYCSEFNGVGVDAGGTIVYIWSERQGTDDAPSATVRTHYLDIRSYDTAGTPGAISANTWGKQILISPKTKYFNELDPKTLVYFHTSTSISPARLRDWSEIYIQYPGSMTLNGITYTDVAIRIIPGLSRRRIQAKGIGPIYRDDAGSSHGGANVEDIPTLIYSRVNGTEAGVSNLTGTPFDPAGGTLDGVFF